MPIQKGMFEFKSLDLHVMTMTTEQRWARSGFARQYQYQHFCKGQMHDNTNIKIETTPILLANINIKNVDFDYAFKFNINI